MFPCPRSGRAPSSARPSASSACTRRVVHPTTFYPPRCPFFPSPIFPPSPPQAYLRPVPRLVSACVHALSFASTTCDGLFARSGADGSSAERVDALAALFEDDSKARWELLFLSFLLTRTLTYMCLSLRLGGVDPDRGRPPRHRGAPAPLSGGPPHAAAAAGGAGRRCIGGRRAGGTQLYPLPPLIFLSPPLFYPKL